MRRIVFVVIVLFVSATISIAVALVIAWRSPESAWRWGNPNVVETVGVDDADDPAWVVQISKLPGRMLIEREPFSEGYTDRSELRVPLWAVALDEDDAASNHRGGARVTEVAYGWPFPSLAYEYRWRNLYVGFSGRLRYLDELNGGVARSDITVVNPINEWYDTLSVMPTRLAWSGFALNTLLIAVILGGSIAGVRTLRAAKRRRAGRCVTCAYPVPETGVCPECGRTA